MKILMIFLVILAEAVNFGLSAFFIAQAVIHFRKEKFILFGVDISLAVFFLALFIKAVVS